VARDGTLLGPNLEELAGVIDALPSGRARVILAGGIGSIEHIRDATRVSGLDAIIIGRALYEGCVDLVEALAAVRD
jgi:phosphoribosylformimino-5-aminoimidazole carboxamide ribotide isomerase